MKQRMIMSVTLATLLSACNSETTVDGREIICTAEIVPAITVDVFEQETGFAFACGATVTITDGDFTESTTLEDGENCENDTSFTFADERPGTYHVLVSKPDFQNWEQSDVVITANVCHVNPVTLQAYLEP